MQDQFAADSGERNQQRKKQEIINRVLAGSIVSQLLNSGCDEGQIIDFATEILERVTDRSWGPGDAGSTDGDGDGLREISFRQDVSEESVRPVLHGERVALVPLAERHVPILKRWREQSHIQGTCSHKLLTELLETDPDSWKDRYDFVVQDEADISVGLVSLFRVNRAIRQAEVAKLVGEPKALGTGYAREATCLLLGYAFHALDLQRVYLRTNGFNLQNIRLNEKIGFRFEGILRASDVLNQELVDVVLMSMLGREFYRMYRIREPSSCE